MEKPKTLKLLLETVKKYGFHVFPLQQGKKIPLKGFGWKELSSRNPEVISEWFNRYPNCNWALDCGKSEIAVIDLDLVVPTGENNYKSEDGLLTLSAMAGTDISRLNEKYLNHPIIRILAALKVPETLIGLTPGQGLHLIYGGKIRNSSRTIGPGIDTRGVGGYIVIPPSVISGKTYDFIFEYGELKPIPDFFVEKLKAGKEKPKSIKGVSAFVNHIDEEIIESQEAVQAVIELLRTAPIAEEGSGGDMLTLQTVYRIRDLGVSEDMAFSLMNSFWNGRCVPPWESNELKVKVRNAYVYAEEPVGSRSTAVIFKDYIKVRPDGGIPLSKQDKMSTVNPADPSEPKPALPLIDRIVWHSALAAEKPPPREWLIPEWIPAYSATYITGQGGVGKSLLTYQMGVSIAFGKPWLGIPIENSRPVLAVMCEDPKDEIHRRAYRIAEYKDYVGELNKDDRRMGILSGFGHNFRFCRMKNGNAVTTEFFKEFTGLLEHPQYRGSSPFLILDTVTDLYGLNENDRGMVNLFVKNVLGNLIVDYNCTILTIGHPPKDTTAEYSGSTGWDTAYRQRLYMAYFSDDHKRLSEYRKLIRSKSNFAARGEELRMEYSDGVLTPLAGEPVDQMELVDMDILAEEIERLAEKGTPTGMTAQNDIPLRSIPINNALGKEMRWEEKKRLVTRLKLEGRIQEVKGSKRKNGLFLTVPGD